MLLSNVDPYDHDLKNGKLRVSKTRIGAQKFRFLFGVLSSNRRQSLVSSYLYLLHKRNLEQIALEASPKYPVVMPTEPGQMRKSTMLQKLMQGKDRDYVKLYDLNERALGQSD